MFRKIFLGGVLLTRTVIRFLISTMICSLSCFFAIKIITKASSWFKLRVYNAMRATFLCPVIHFCPANIENTLAIKYFESNYQKDSTKVLSFPSYLSFELLTKLIDLMPVKIVLVIHKHKYENY